MVKHLFTMRQTKVRSLGWEDPLKKKMATHSRTIAWKIPWTEAPGRLQSRGSQRVRRNGATSLSHVVYYYLAECISPSGLGWSLQGFPYRASCYLHIMTTQKGGVNFCYFSFVKVLNQDSGHNIIKVINNDTLFVFCNKVCFHI